MKAIITVGISASGKTTWAKDFCKKNDYINLNRDDARFSLFGFSDWNDYKFTKDRESFVTQHQLAAIKLAAEAGKNIVISNTNLNKKYRDELISDLQLLGYQVSLKDFPVSYEEAVHRDSQRGGGVGSKVIYSQWKQWLEYCGRKRYTPDIGLPKAIIFDIDGTLAKMQNRGPFEWDKVKNDLPRFHIIDMALGYALQGYKIICLSGRDSVCREETEWWLRFFEIPYSELYMRVENDCSRDTLIKEEFFWPLTERYNISAVVDDRTCMTELWQDIGLNVISVGDNREVF